MKKQPDSAAMSTFKTPSRQLLALSAVLTFCNPSFAQQSYTKQFSACMDKSDGVTIAMRSCINDEINVQDAILNNNYKSLQNRISSKRKSALLEAQRAWLSYRKLNCNFFDDPEGGTAATLMAHDCFLRMTASRAEELANLD